MRERERVRERERGPGVTRYHADDVQYTLMGPGKYSGRTVDTDRQEITCQCRYASVAMVYPLKKKGRMKG